MSLSRIMRDRTSLVGALLLAAAAGVAWLTDEPFGPHYLVAWLFWLSLALGGLFFVAIQNLTSAKWSEAIRPVAEKLASTMPLVALLALPILGEVLVGNTSTFRWLDHELVEHSALLQKKAPWLNGPFFVARLLVYLCAWIWISRALCKRVADVELRRRRSAPILLVYAVTVTLASFDLIMSLEPEWFSTILGVYYFSGAVIGFLSLLACSLAALQKDGRMASIVTSDHFHDVGKLLFAFVFFWGYIAFSQFMLIWYANIPEETVWYAERSHGIWKGISWTLLFGHLLIPFLALLSAHAKRHVPTLVSMSVWLLGMHWLDLYWLVLPSVPAAKAFHAVDLLVLTGTGALFAGTALRFLHSIDFTDVRERHGTARQH